MNLNQIQRLYLQCRQMEGEAPTIETEGLSCRGNQAHSSVAGSRTAQYAQRNIQQQLSYIYFRHKRSYVRFVGVWKDVGTS